VNGRRLQVLINITFVYCWCVFMPLWR